MKEETKRTKKSIYNITSNFLIFFLKVFLTFFVRKILIIKISQTYIGLNGLFSNILSILSLAELGLGSAIGFSLYKPLANKNDKEISSLMSFYRKAYMLIGTSITIIGICLIPFLKIIVKEPIENMILIYLLFLINTSSLYFISYKDVLITSDQKQYKLTWINLIFTILLNVGELAILFITGNFICYLIIQFAINIIQRICTNIFITRQYKNIEFKTKNKLEIKKKNEIFKNIKAMFFHKVGDSMVNATDNIIISTVIDINTVGIYSNYFFIVSFLTNLASIIYSGILASLGNFIVTENTERKYEMFNKTNFLGFTIFSYFSVLLINVFNIGIEIIANKDYILNISTVLLIILNFYITGVRIASSNMKTAAGIFDLDKYTPIIQAVINIFTSVILAKFIGLNGVLIGTLLSSILPSIQRPYIVYKYILKEKCMEYFKEYAMNLALIVITASISYIININILIQSQILLLIQRTAITSIIFLIFYFIFYRKKSEFIFYRDMLINFVRRLQHAK